jgi:hypothetical protein
MPPSHNQEIATLISLSYKSGRISSELIALSISGSPVPPHADQTLCAAVRRHHISDMHLELNDVQAEVLTRELHNIIQSDRYPLTAQWAAQV